MCTDSCRVHIITQIYIVMILMFAEDWVNIIGTGFIPMD